jgi:hypothetical protein
MAPIKSASKPQKHYASPNSFATVPSSPGQQQRDISSPIRRNRKKQKRPREAPKFDAFEVFISLNYVITMVYILTMIQVTAQTESGDLESKVVIPEDGIHVGQSPHFNFTINLVPVTIMGRCDNSSAVRRHIIASTRIAAEDIQILPP